MEKKLERNQRNKMIAGVASGLADYLSIDATLIRVAFIILAVFGFSGVLIYLALWIVVPEKPFFHDFSSFNSDYKMNEESTNASNQPPPFYQNAKKSDSGRLVAGLLLIAVGGWFMLAEFGVIPPWFSILKLWPVFLIALGLLILSRSGKKKAVDFNATKPPVSGTDTKTESETTDQPLT